MLSSTKPHNRILTGALIVLVALVLAGCSSLPFASTGSTSAAVQTNPAVASNDNVAPAPANLPQTTISVTSTDQEALADLYERVAPSVVNIQVTMQQDAVQPGQQTPNPFGFPFNLPQTPSTPAQALGTGWVYDTAGHIVTNNHVVENAEQIMVTFSDGLWAEAELVAADPQADLAVIKVNPPEGETLQPLPLADSDTLRVGYSVIAIGTPFGLESTMTTGIVSALGRDFPVGDATSQRYSLPEVIQTDAAINPGNSGGPLLNLSGEVVGVNFAIESPVRGSSGIGFAIPTSVVRRVVPDLINEGKHEYAYLGISGNSITPTLAQALDLPNTVLGAYVATVTDGGPAAAGGLQGGSREVQVDGGTVQVGGDIIIAIDGQPVRQFNDLVAYLVTDAAPGQTVTLTVLRNGETLDLDVTLGSRPATVEPAPAPEGGITARAAIGIARDYAQQQNLLDGQITETVVTQLDQGGRAVWVVELSTPSQTARITVDAQSGEVLDSQVQ